MNSVNSTVQLLALSEGYSSCLPGGRYIGSSWELKITWNVMIISVVNLMRSTVTWEMSLWPHLGVIILICSIVGGTIHWVWTLGCAKAENEVFIILCFFFMVSVWPAVFSTMTHCDIKLWAKISPSSLSFLCRVLLLEHQEKNLKHTKKSSYVAGFRVLKLPQNAGMGWGRK